LTTRLGPEHPDTAWSLDNLAKLLRAQGDLAGARPLFERALAICEKVFGPEHPDTAQSLNQLGDLLREQGELARARPLCERALAIEALTFGLVLACSPLRRNQRDQFFLGRLARRFANHPILESKTAAAVQKNLPPIRTAIV
jgi:tetratricopeptide (TPR) repeat protein